METNISTLLAEDTVNLCERYKRINMETLIITVDPKMSSITQWGSYLGELFLQKKKAIPRDFLEFCIGERNTSQLSRKGKKNKNSVLAEPVQELQDVNKRPKRQRKLPSWRKDYVDTEGSSSKKHKSDNDVHDDISRGSCVPNTPAESQGDHSSGVRAGTSAKDTNNVHDEGIVKVEQEETNEKYHLMEGNTTSNSSVSKRLNSSVPKMMVKTQNELPDKRIAIHLLSDSKELSTSSEEASVMSHRKGIEKFHNSELSMSTSEAVINKGTQVVDDWHQVGGLGNSVEARHGDNNDVIGFKHAIVNDGSGDNKQNMVKIRFKCKFCSKVMSEKKLLEEHLKQEHNHTSPDNGNSSIEQVFQCGICLKEFLQLELLQFHHDKMHSCVLKDTCTGITYNPNKKKDEGEKLCHVKVEGQTSDSKGQTQDTVGAVSKSKHQNLNGQQKSNLKLNLRKKGFRTTFRLNVHKKPACAVKNFACQLCSVNFKYESSLFKHLLLKHRSKVCPRCKLVLDDEKKMKEHCLGCTADAKRVTYKCSHCYKSFATADGLNCHMEKHQGTEFECNKCKKMFFTSSSLNVHLKTHPNNQSHLCNTCGKIFSKRPYLRRHLRTIHDIYLGKRIVTEYKIKCNICSKDFTSKSDLVKHIDATHMTDILQKVKPNSRFTLTSSNESLKCPVCAKESPNENEYTLHLAKHASETPATFACEFCGKLFTKKSHFKTHLSIHTNNKPFSCEICGKTFVTKSALASHMYTHRDYNEFVCYICGNAFKSVASLKAHIKAHDRTRFHACKYCHRKFRCFDGIKTHWLSEHPNEIEARKLKVYTCQYCSKEFATSQTYKRHVASHTGVKNEVCDVCNAKYATVSQLNAHRKNIHFGERKLRCTACDVKFLIPSRMKRHMASLKHRENCIRLGIDMEVFERLVQEAVEDNEKNSRNRRSMDTYVKKSTAKQTEESAPAIPQPPQEGEVLEIELPTKSDVLEISNVSDVLGYIVISNAENTEGREEAILDVSATEALQSMLM